MRMVDLIRKKRDGGELSKEEIRYFTEGFTKGEIPDYQASALLMATVFQGMSPEETAELTFAIRDSGEKLDFSKIDGIRADKHSTGGVGDKTSLIVVPIVAACGVKVAKISGRGLGHTGGTVDKLESIPGYRTELSDEEFIENVNRVGAAIVGQSREVAPADKLLYALRDVTATVDSLPLIVSSIMGKKLAAGDDCIVLDVKSGSGAFMKTLEDSRRLAEALTDIGKRAGKKMMALITDMDRPLGAACGNALEVIEAIETLKGRGPEDLTELCIELSAAILELAGKGEDEEACKALAREAIADGSALQVLENMIRAQGGDPEVIRDYERFPKALYAEEVFSKESGYIQSMDTEGIGKASLLLGAGRNTMEEAIDPGAGIILKAKTGDYVEEGAALAVFYTSDEKRLEDAKNVFLSALTFGPEAPEERPLILDRVL